MFLHYIVKKFPISFLEQKNPDYKIGMSKLNKISMSKLNNIRPRHCVTTFLAITVTTPSPTSALLHSSWPLIPIDANDGYLLDTGRAPIRRLSLSGKP